MICLYSLAWQYLSSAQGIIDFSRISDNALRGREVWSRETIPSGHSRLHLEMVQTGEIGVEGLQVGIFVEADYYNPTGLGRVYFNLLQDSKNVALHFNPRFDMMPNVLVLNTMQGGSWGPEERPGGYDFSHGIRVKVRIYADQRNFKIFINDKFFYQYKYRGITCSQVKKIQFSCKGDNATAAQLISLRAGYMSNL